LFNSVRNGAIDYLRHKNIETKHRLSFAKMSLMSHNDVGEDDFFTEEIFRQLFQTIDALPPRQKEVFLLSMKGKRYKDIAQQLNISVETVKKQKQRAMEKPEREAQWRCNRAAVAPRYAVKHCEKSRRCRAEM